MVMLFAVLSFVVNIRPIADGHRLSESLSNEVEHAIERAEKAREKKSGAKGDKRGASVIPKKIEGDIFGTNSLNATQIAVKIVSMQQPDGQWRIRGTNVTHMAVEILNGLR